MTGTEERAARRYAGSVSCFPSKKREPEREKAPVGIPLFPPAKLGEEAINDQTHVTW